jgi:hypothetical protein
MGMIHGTIGMIQGTIGMIQGTIGMIQSGTRWLTLNCLSSTELMQIIGTIL